MIFIKYKGTAMPTTITVHGPSGGVYQTTESTSPDRPLPYMEVILLSDD